MYQTLNTSVERWDDYHMRGVLFEDETFKVWITFTARNIRFIQMFATVNFCKCNTVNFAFIFSHASCMDDNVSWSVHHFGQISQQLLDELPCNLVEIFMVPREWILITSGIPRFPIAPSSCQSFHLSWEVCSLDWQWHDHVSDFSHPLTFPVAPTWGSYLWFWGKCLNYWMYCRDIWYTHVPLRRNDLNFSFSTIIRSKISICCIHWFMTKNLQN